MNATTADRPATASAQPNARREPVHLLLFVAGNTPHSLDAIERAREFCRLQFRADDKLEVIDLAARPDLAESHQIIALPALVRVHPVPRRTWVGDLADTSRLLVALGLQADAPGAAPVSRPVPPVVDDARDALRAIAAGEVDAWLTRGANGQHVVARPGSETAYRQLIETADHGTATLAIDGTILYGNRCLADWLEVEPGRLAGRSLWSHLDEAGATTVRALIGAAHEGRAADDVTVRSANGRIRMLRLSFSSLSADGQGERLGLVVTDVEDFRAAVTELDWYREHLEDLVVERTARLQEALHAAEAAGRSKARFLANMSHEIRTPLNGILGMVHLMRVDALPPVQAERLRKIEQSGQHLLSLLTEILDLTRIDAQRVTLASEAVDAAGLLRRVADMLDESARAKGLALTIDAPPALPDGLRGDSRRLLQALLNLVGNAIKFTDQGEVTLRLVSHASAADAAVLRFEVDDTGAGITPELRARLFRPFERGEPSPTGRQQSGTGLGLAITRQLSRLMGGDCGVGPRPGGGSRFWFTARLTLSAPPARVGARKPLAASAELPLCMTDEARQLASQFRGSRILLVEDDPVNTEVAQGILVAAELEVHCAADGAAALARVAAGEQFAVVLMDMLMPGMDGLEATRRIRALPAGREVPIVAMTANAFAEDRARCLEAGMDDFMTKPIDPNALFATLARWMSAGGAATHSGCDGAAQPRARDAEPGVSSGC